jgi:hypothetical protein
VTAATGWTTCEATSGAEAEIEMTASVTEIGIGMTESEAIENETTDEEIAIGAKDVKNARGRTL